jgi:ribosomal-protein-serine acetyltransferase
VVELHAGPELLLRSLRLEDATALFAETDRSRARLRRWLPWVDRTLSPADTAAFIRIAMEQEAEGEGFHALVLWQGRLAGVIGHHGFQPAQHSISLGYWLGDGFEGRGLITAAARAMIAYAFAAMGVHRVEIRAAVANRRSRSVAERLGFRLEGILRDAELLPDGFADHAVYGLLADDWARLRGMADAGGFQPIATGPGHSGDPSAPGLLPEGKPPPSPRAPAPRETAAATGHTGHPRGRAAQEATVPPEHRREPPTEAAPAWLAAAVADSGGDDPALDAEMAAYYDARAPEYDDWYERRGLYARREGHAAWYAELTSLHGVVARFAAALPAGAAVCDLGCGTGRWTAALAEAGLRLTGLDQSPAMLEQALRRLDGLGLRASLVRGDVLDPPFPTGSFDAACVAFVFDHLSRSQRLRLLQEVRRLLRPGGRLLVLDSRREQRHAAEMQVQTRVLRDGRTFRVRKGLFTAATLAEALRPMGSAIRAGETPTFFVWAEVSRPR